MNWLCVHTVAIVVFSLIVTLAGGGEPTDAIRAMAGLSPLDGRAAGLPPFAARYSIDPLGTDGALIENRPSVPVRPWPTRCGLPAPAAKSVTVELAIGAPAPRTWPATFAAKAVVQSTALTRARIAAAHIATLEWDVMATTPAVLRKDGSHWVIEMTTASPPRLKISPVRLAFKWRITPASFCIQRSPALDVPIAKP